MYSNRAGSIIVLAMVGISNSISLLSFCTRARIHGRVHIIQRRLCSFLVRSFVSSSVILCLAHGGNESKPEPILYGWLVDQPVDGSVDRPTDRRIKEPATAVAVATVARSRCSASAVAGAGAVAATAAALNSAHGYCLPDHLGNCWPTALPANRT